MLRNPKTQVWLTPQYILDRFVPKHYDDLCKYPRDQEFDIMKGEWGDVSTTKFINPPFKLLPRLSTLIHKKVSEGYKLIICCPIRYNTNYFQKNLKRIIKEIVILPDRVKFVDVLKRCKTSHQGAPFVTNLLYFNCKCEENSVEKSLPISVLFA